MKLLLPVLLLLTTAAPVLAQTKDPVFYRRGNPYRNRQAIADSSYKPFKGANTLLIRTGKPAAEAYEIALAALRNGGYQVAFANPDSLIFGTQPKRMEQYASTTRGIGAWGRVRPDGSILLYPYYFTNGNNPSILFWDGDLRVTSEYESFHWTSFRDVERAARTYAQGRITYLRTK